MHSLIEHLERTLGPIEYGWSLDPDGQPMPFQIARFMGGSGWNSSAYSTLGLSRYGTSCPGSEKLIRLELLMLAPEPALSDPIVSTIHQVATGVLATGHPILRGEIIGPAGPMAFSDRFEALYVAQPLYFPHEFATATNENGDPVVIAWLIPITAREAEYALVEGWDAFEHKMISQDPDLTSFNRPELLL